MTQSRRPHQSNFDAVINYVRRRTIPLVAEADTRIGVHGTGSLTRIEGRIFLLTAGHVVQGIEDHPNDIGIPLDPKRTGKPATFDQCQISRTSGAEGDLFDIGLIRLSDEISAQVGRNWDCFEMDDLQVQWTHSPTLFLYGFPNSLTEHVGDLAIYHGGFPLFTGPFDGLIGEHSSLTPIDPNRDLLLDLPRRLENNRGSVFPTPNMKGMSGAIIWSLVEVEDLWTPNRALVPVALQHSVIQDKMMIGVRWPHVFEALRRASSSNRLK